MNFISGYRKSIALGFLLLMAIELFTPAVAFALTSGPSQPEMKGFEPIGNSDMVDLFSGDFSYNIPLLDVGGYPVNLAYHSGAGMDDEASWVGYGWSLNVGSFNRQLRGLPDDFNGTDRQEREISMKDHVVKGANLSATLDLLGKPKREIKKKVKKRKLNFSSLSFSIGVKDDNYRGIGVDIGANVGIALSDLVAEDKTGKTDSATFNDKSVGSVGFNLSSMDGAAANLNVKILEKNINNGENSLSKSVGFSYNSRAGLAGMTLNNSLKQFNKESPIRSPEMYSGSSFISFNTDTYTPTIDRETKTQAYTFTLHLGPELFVAFPGFGATGFYSKQSTRKKIKALPSYGFLYGEKGKDNPSALQDMNREKDVPYSPEVKYLPIPVPTYDLFSATSQDGGGQYRAYRGSSAVFFDPKTETSSDEFTLGVEIGAGFIVDGGFDTYAQDIKTRTQKWKDRNQFLSKGDFQLPASFPLHEPSYFKRIGEPVPYDQGYVSKIKGTSPFAVVLGKKSLDPFKGAEATSQVKTKSSRGENTTNLIRDKREVRNTTFSHLTAKEATNHALEKTIQDYHPDSVVITGCPGNGIRNNFQRSSGYRKAHHISEVTITGDDGKRSVYGLPVYNTYQEEVSFSIGADTTKRKKGLIKYDHGIDNSMANKKGREWYYSKEKTPPYATSYLLTAILSPDYIDKTNNGITDDDLGTAVKFNYSKLNNLYKWRTPYANEDSIANYNEGFLSDNLDDKANYVYGEKEVWYLHSIESKTMVAHFVVEDRNDALGVTGSIGAINTSTRLKKLKEIRLYSKSDLRLNNNDFTKVTPIKVVHFEYDYSLCRGLPNSIDNGGKLTLKKVYFTFGFNNKGRLNPYQFQYDTSFNSYDYRQYDRWGNFKDAANNPAGLNNSEYPYVLQDSALTSQFVSAWHLNKIKLPSGGQINIIYESDDYAYVQDKRAAQMCMLNGVNAQGSSSGLIDADYVFVNLPQTVSSRKEMLERYFEGMDKLYFKFFVDLDALGHKEFVPGYASIVGQPELVGNSIAKVKVAKIKKVNPMAKAGWQFLRMNLPKYAYPGSENIESDESGVMKVVTALVGALKSIKELIYGFESRAKNKGFCNNIDLAKSWVRVCTPNKKKLGGGSRVKRIDISDDWTNMSGSSGSITATYSQVYNYTTIEKGQVVSSGVASYEPMIGNDENPFRQPINYKKGQFLGLDNYFYIEEPFGESLFPAANVGYSKVTVKSIGTGDEETVNRTGTVVSEFFTARDYPTKVDVLGIDTRVQKSNKLTGLIGMITYDVRGLSQGYSVELNDMHGKPKSVNIFNKSSENISSVRYFYKTTNELAEKKELSNEVKVISANGIVTDGSIGMDVETYTDMREQTTENLGLSVKFSGGLGSILIFPLPFVFPGIGANKDFRSYRASSTIKIVNRFAIQYKVQKIENGSSITTENLLWDAETGNVLFTKTQNEFDDPVYSFAYPAHWVYDGMAQAYRNLGTVLSSFSTNSNGQVTSSSYSELLVPGDELIDINSGLKYWIINTPVNSVYEKRVIDKDGNIQQLSNLTLKLLRSGRRNMANTAIATIASLKNPIVGDKLDISSLSKILDAKGTTFSDEWEMPMYRCPTCPAGYYPSDDGQFCYKDTLPTLTQGCFTVCQGSHDGSYSVEGTYIYQPGYDTTGAGIVQDSITNLTDPTNRFWVGGTCSSGGGGAAAQSQNKSVDVLNGQNQEFVFDSSEFNTSNANSNSISGDFSTNVVGDCVGNPNTAWGTTYCGPLHRTSIWSCQGNIGSGVPTGIWLGFSKCINVDSAKTYYIGIAGDNGYKFLVDGVLKLSVLNCNSQSPFKKWRIYPIVLTQGQHIIELLGYNCGGPAAFGAEIYNNTVPQIKNATSVSQLNIVFSTRDMVGQEFDIGHYSCPNGYALSTCSSPFTCRIIIPAEGNNIINPYFTGLKGNWRPKSQFVYQINRENMAGDPGKTGSTNVRKSGAYSVFNPFWAYNTSTQIWEANPANDNRWTAANEVTYFNTKGTEIENKDALNRYSSALFGYLQSLPVAVASNARYREIAFDGFEDYGFSLGCETATCDSGQFSFKKKLNGSSVLISNVEAHSGKYSLSLNGSVELSRSVYNGLINPLYTYDATGRYSYGSNDLAKGFSPIPGKKYVLSFWVKDGAPRSSFTNVQAIVNGQSLVTNLAKWPIVEGWKRVEVPFVFSATATNFKLQLQSGGGTVYLDDIRIHPYDGQLKSFAYDPSSQRLMAELDENNFATFYEYDDEGILIRVKKETDRGIMTIKETRSAYRKQ